MAMSLDKKPIYDERVNEILRGLTEGKTRDELAEEFGYANYKSLDMHMRRRNFTWDRDKQTYMPIYNRLEERDLEVSLTASSKAATVLSLFQKEGADARTIAKRLGFTDHRELAVYMKGKGYEWSSEAGNYVKMRGQVQEDLGNDNSSLQDFGEEDREAGQGQPLGATTPVPVRFTQLEGGKLEKYLPLLEMLERNKDKLIDLLVPTAEDGKVPRYTIPGIFVTKSVHMTNTLDQLVRDYSKEKNISQRDIFTVALLDFFRRYGYEREVETLVGQN
ncbi:hypothetical protein P9761_24470 [Brevibacillus centrosporus]|uniref:hypothetical protein n=1 Tax=Brevibacillus centrosporus TaxID=54910 RepID=UPI000F0A5142|nr:hypothetical protein [Brevibacillus centrosporus]MEC2130534.1 hypothetical protein [Brevibacillus centrosporus]MED4911334.1 hypothetical protein [Brevibacillus centrosporus]RNB68864.1 hypothetical protein EDM55_15745 [Brevibacillus centrosporus]GED34940.1 hypothetical protein BCE02nite_60810 [Brevibacillus centrosporus]